MNTMFYLFLATEGGHPTREENFIGKKIPKCKVFFLSPPNKLNKQKQRDVIKKYSKDISV